jgi:hypothetical protein
MPEKEMKSESPYGGRTTIRHAREDHHSDLERGKAELNICPVLFVRKVSVSVLRLDPRPL